MPENRNQQGDVGLHSVNDRVLERRGQPVRGRRRGLSPGDDLGEQGIETRRNGSAFDHSGVHPDVFSLRLAVAAEPPGTRGERVPGRFGEDPRLDRRSPGRERPKRLGPGYGRRQGIGPNASGERQLRIHQVHPVHLLGHRVLDLQPGVHFQEEEAPVPIQEELHRPRTPVAASGHQPERRLPHPRAEILRDSESGRPLHELLPAALDRTLPLAQMDPAAPSVAEDLNLDVPRPVEPAFEKHPAIAEGRVGFGGRRRQGAGQILRAADDADPDAPTAGRRLDRTGEVEPCPLRLPHAVPGGGEPLRRQRGEHGNAYRNRGLPRGFLVTESAHGLGGRSHETDTGSLYRSGKRGTLRQEAVSRVQQVRPKALRRRDHGRPVQKVRNFEDLVSLRPHRRPAVGGSRDHCHRVAAPTRGPEDPPRDLAPVGDQQPRRRRGHEGPSAGRATRGL